MRSVVFDGVEEFAESFSGGMSFEPGLRRASYTVDLTHRIALKGTVAHSQRHHAAQDAAAFLAPCPIYTGYEVVQLLDANGSDGQFASPGLILRVYGVLVCLYGAGCPALGLSLDEQAAHACRGDIAALFSPFSRTPPVPPCVP